MSDKQHEIIAFRRTGRVEKVPAGGWSEQPRGSVIRWGSDTCGNHHTVTPIDPTNLVECEGGIEGAVERVMALLDDLRTACDWVNPNIRRAITGTPPEPEFTDEDRALVEEILSEVAGRGIVAFDRSKAPELYAAAIDYAARLIAKHYRASNGEE